MLGPAISTRNGFHRRNEYANTTPATTVASASVPL
jgi:hypothetical protein